MKRKSRFLKAVACLLAVLMVIGIAPAGIFASAQDPLESLPDLPSLHEPRTSLGKITYVSDYVMAPEPVEVFSFQTLMGRLPELQHPGYVFEGWYYDSSYTRRANELDSVCGNTTLYAKWRNPVTWIYDELYNCIVLKGVIVEPFTFVSKYVLPKSFGFNRKFLISTSLPDSVRNNMLFEGTHTDLNSSAAESMFEFSNFMQTTETNIREPISSSLPCLNTVLLDYDIGGPSFTTKLYSGTNIQLPTPVIEGSELRFVEWLGSTTLGSLGTVTISSDVEYHALWEAKKIRDFNDNICPAGDWQVRIFRGAVFISKYLGSEPQVILPKSAYVYGADYYITSLGIPRSILIDYDHTLDPNYLQNPFDSPDYGAEHAKEVLAGHKVFDDIDCVISTTTNIKNATNAGHIGNLYFDCPDPSVTDLITYSSITDWTYPIDLYSNTTKITGYNGTWNDVIIPMYVGGHYVTELGDGTNPVFPNQMSRVKLPKTVTTINTNALKNIDAIDYDGTLNKYKQIQGYSNYDAGATLRLIYPVTFNYNGVGPANKTVYVKYGNKVERPDDPADDHYNFKGWFSNPSLTDNFDFDAEITDQQTAYASWIPAYDVTLPEAPEGYSVAAESDTHVEQGENFFFTITPEPGYDVSDLVVRTNGSAVIDYSNQDGSCRYGIYGIRENKTVTIANTVDTWEYEITGGGTAVSITKYNGHQTDVYVPDTIEGLPVIAIGSGAFSGNYDIHSVYIPLSVVCIDPFAFCDCINLSEVDGTDNVTEIGESAFKDCDGLESIYLPSVSCFGNKAFEGCTSLISVLTENAVYFGQDAFKNSGATLIHVCGDVEFIGSGAFNNSNAAIEFDGTAAGWAALTAGKNVVDASQIVDCLKATVSFDTFGACDAPEDVEITKYESINLPQTLEAENYIFGGWYTDSACTVPAESPCFIDDDTVFYAKLTEIISYIDENGDEQTCTDYTVITNESTPFTMTTGWYVVRETVALYDRAVVDGDVNVILCDGATFINYEGTSVNEGNSLTVYAQSTGQDAGTWYASVPADYAACIGSDRYTKSGEINIWGGIFRLHGQFYAACIGGGDEGSAGPITIGGGIIDAYASNDAACIGAGDNGDADQINILGGTLLLDADGFDAICIGASGGDAEINIAGGAIEMTVNSSRSAMGLGTDDNSKTANITLSYTDPADSYLIPSYTGNLSFEDGYVFCLADTVPVVKATAGNLKGHRIMPFEGDFVTVEIMNGDTVLQSYNMAQGSLVPEPEALEANGIYSFLGWYDDSTNQPFAFEAPVQQDTLILAKFVEPYSSFNATAGTDTNCGYKEEHDNLVDNDKQSKWCITSYSEGTLYVEFTADNMIVPTGYILTTCGDTSNYPGRNPAEWKIEGKAKCTDEWTVLAEVSGDSAYDLGTDDSTDYLFEIDNADENAYRFFRFSVNGVIDGDCFQLAELQLVVNSISDVPQYTVGFDANGGSGSMDPASLRDGDVLPESEFIAPESDLYQRGWTVNGISYRLTDAIPLSGDTTAYAEWAGNHTVTIDPNGGEIADSEWINGISVREIDELYLPYKDVVTPPEGKVFDHWEIDGVSYDTGESYIADGDLTIVAVWGDISAWEALNLQLADEYIDVIVLNRDVIASVTDECLIVPEGRTVTLDLNGYTIDRSLSDTGGPGYVMQVQGWLTLIDSSPEGTGKITGGHNDYEGGGVFIDENATLDMQGGMITGNYAMYGAGVEVYGELIMSGGVVTGNYATDDCGGVECYRGSITLYGKPVITGNYIFDGEELTDSNMGIYDVHIDIDGSLESGACIGIGYVNSGTAFADIADDDTTSFGAFFSDDDDLAFTLEPGDEGFNEIIVCDSWAVPDRFDVYGHSLTLNGDIGVNYYVYIKNPSFSSYAEFELDGITVTAPIDFDKFTIVYGYKYFKFTCEVNSPQISSEISCKVYSDTYDFEDDPYSVNDYLTLVETDPDYSSDENLVNLCRAIATYGYYANELFEYNDEFEKHDLFDDSDFDRISAQITGSCEASITGYEGGVDYYGSSLLLKAKTSIRHYFTLPAGKFISDYTFLLSEGDGTVELKPVKSGKLYYVEIADIASPNLSDMQTVYVVNSDGVPVNTWVYSPMSYVYNVLSLENADPDLVNAVKALALYAAAAYNYFIG